MFLDVLIFIVSLAGLVFSADYFIDRSVELSHKYRLPKMVVGLTIVAIGTSLPEAAASLMASLSGHPEIAIGNVVGSNICNIALILGLPALLAPIVAQEKFVRRDGRLMLLVSTVLFALAAFTGSIPSWAGYIFLAAFVGYIFCLLKYSDSATIEEEAEEEDYDGLIVFVGKLVASGGGIIISSNFLVDSTVSLARAFSVSEAVIALSMLALGTSLPELSVSIAAVKKQEGDILVGNIFGSNISNILMVLGLSSVVSAIPVKDSILQIDLPIMLATSFLMVYFLSRPAGIDKPRGIFFLAIYISVILRCFLIA